MHKKSREPEPSLDDTRWQPVQEEYKLLGHRTGHSQFALIDLNEALANGHVRSMRRHLKTGKREQLSSNFWRDHALHIWSYQSGLFVALRHLSHPGRIDPIDDFVFFVWHPDVAMVWPALREADHEVTPLLTPLRAKPGTKPRRDWPTLVAAWLILKACEDQNQLENIDALVRGAEDHLRKEIGWAPENTQHIRRKIVELLWLVRR